MNAINYTLLFEPDSLEGIVEEINNSSHYVSVCLCWLYSRQTHPERVYKASLFRNGVGFNAVDAPRLSRYLQIAKTRPLTEKELEDVKRSLRKYVGQIFRARVTADLTT